MLLINKYAPSCIWRYIARNQMVILFCANLVCFKRGLALIKRFKFCILQYSYVIITFNVS